MRDSTVSITKKPTRRLAIVWGGILLLIVMVVPYLAKLYFHWRISTLYQNLTGEQADAMARLRASTALAESGAAGADALTKALRHSDPRVRMRSLDALARMGPVARDAIPTLIEKLDETDGDERHTILTTIERIGDLQVLENRLAQLLNDPRTEVNEITCKFIVLTGTRAIPEMEKAQSSSRWQTRRYTVFAAWNLALEEKIHPAIERLYQRALLDDVPEVRAPALYILLNTHRASLQDVLKAIREGSPTEFALGVEAMARFPNQANEFAQALGTRIHQPLDMEQRNLVYTGLASLHRHGNVVLPDLRRCFQDDNVSNVVFAAQLLHLYGANTAPAIEPLRRYEFQGQYDYPSVERILALIVPNDGRRIAEQAMAQLRMSHMQQDYEGMIRALWKLRRLGPLAAPSVPLLMTILEDLEKIPPSQLLPSNGYTRSPNELKSLIVNLFTELRTDAAAAVPFLERLIQHPYSVQSSVEALTALVAIQPNHPRLVDELANLVADNRVFNRVSAMRLLARTTDQWDRRVKLLREGLLDNNQEVQIAAVESLARIAAPTRDKDTLLRIALLLRDEKMELQITAAIALGHWGADSRVYLPRIQTILRAAMARIATYSRVTHFESRLAADPRITNLNLAIDAIKRDIPFVLQSRIDWEF